MSKTIGILGGMGPLATADLFKKIVTLTDASCDQEHIHILIDNNTEIPDRTGYIIGGGKNPEEYLIRTAVKLESMGADAIIMPCNTAHYFYDKIVQHIKVPLLNMIEETAKQIKTLNPSLKKAGLLATEGTCRSGIYDRIFELYGIQLLKPDSIEQQYVTDLIYGIKQGKTDMDLNGFYGVISKLKSMGAETLILGCTELPVAFEMFNIREDSIDPTRALACSAIKFAEKKVVGE